MRTDKWGECVDRDDEKGMRKTIMGEMRKDGVVEMDMGGRMNG